MYKMTVENYELKPSEVAINKWAEQTYYYNANATNPGDLRGPVGSYIGPDNSMDVQASENVITKYLILEADAQSSQAIFMYRVATLYLRYA